MSIDSSKYIHTPPDFSLKESVDKIINLLSLLTMLGIYTDDKGLMVCVQFAYKYKAKI